MSDKCSVKNILNPTFNDPRLEPKERLNESKLFIMFKDLPEKSRELLKLSSDELILLAADAETIRKSTSFGDYALGHFIREEGQLLSLAELIQNRERYLHKLV
jgi:hypothetical protein